MHSDLFLSTNMQVIMRWEPICIMISIFHQVFLIMMYMEHFLIFCCWLFARVSFIMCCTCSRILLSNNNFVEQLLLAQTFKNFVYRNYCKLFFWKKNGIVDQNEVAKFIFVIWCLPELGYQFNMGFWICSHFPTMKILCGNKSNLFIVAGVSISLTTPIFHC